MPEISNTIAPQVPSDLLRALHAIQRVKGYVSREAALSLSRETGVPLARIFEVLTFYSYFRVSKPGRIVIAVCLGTSCHLQGGNPLLKQLEDLLGIRAGEATPDGVYQLNVVRCLGCCARSPVLKVDGEVYGNVEPSEVDFILKAHAAGHTAREGRHG